MKTKAAILVEAGKPFEIDELEVITPGEREVLVRYDYSGLCHSDLHFVKGHIPFRSRGRGGGAGGRPQRQPGEAG
jgi:S-(hydroxymethyl)glutathione dehydrogenase/alcohol dehydrogenase